MILPTKVPYLYNSQVLFDFDIVKVGRRASLDCIGRGRFTCAYKNHYSNEVFLFVFHGDLSKDVLSHVRKNTPHIPPMEYLGRQDVTIKERYPRVADVYRTKKFYVAKTASAKYVVKQHPHLQALNKAHKQASEKYSGNLIADDQCVAFNEYLIDIAEIPDSIRKALTRLKESAKDWGPHYLFDTFRPDNVGFEIDNIPAGNIILLDPMFDAAVMQRHHRHKALQNRRTHGK